MAWPARTKRRRHDRGLRQTRHHAQYLEHWLNVVKAAKKAIFTAASEASEAAAFLAALVFCIKAKRGQLGAP
jgi:antirestriction protein ArdC